MTSHPDPSFYRKMQGIGVVIFLIFALLSSMLYVSAKATTQERTDTKKTFKAVICRIEVETLAGKSLTPANKKLALTFYNDLLVKDVHTTGCGLKVKG